MSQTQPYVFVWTHGGKRVSLAGTFNGWTPEPVPRQGNYFVTVKNIPEGHHQYKFVVDNVWLYDVDQTSADDGSGNWNNVAVIGDEEHCPYLHSHDNKQQGAHHQQHQQHQQQQHHREAALTSPTPAKQAKKDVQQTEASSEKPALSKKEQRKQEFEQKQQQKQQQEGGAGKKGGKGGQGGQGGQQQKQQQQKTPQKAPEPEEEEEAAPAAQAEEEAPAPPPAKEAKKEKSSESMVVVDVATADIDTDIAALEAFVRSVNPAGLKWEGSSVSDYVFGLKKLTIICRCQDDVSVEDVCSQLEQNNELVGSAQIQSFSC